MAYGLAYYTQSVQFSPLTGWVVGGTWGTIQQRSSSCLFYGRPLWVLPWAGKSTFWCCSSSISSADHGLAHPPRCPDGWLWKLCRSLWHARTMQVSVSWQLPEDAPVDPQGRWSCSAPSRWSYAPSMTPQWGAADAEIKVPSGENTELKTFSL